MKIGAYIFHIPGKTNT